MLCCSEQEAPMGLARFPKQQVIDACRHMLKHIADTRRKKQRRSINQELEKQLRSWKRFWRWLGIPKPTRRNAIDCYRNARPAALGFIVIFSLTVRANL